MRIPRSRVRTQPVNPGILSDIAFLLIIFFLLIAVFNREAGLPLILPTDAPSRAERVLLSVRIRRDGGYELSGRMMSSAELTVAIEELLRRSPDATLLARIDPEAPYGALVTLVDRARALGVVAFSFDMEEE